MNWPKTNNIRDQTLFNLFWTSSFHFITDSGDRKRVQNTSKKKRELSIHDNKQGLKTERPTLAQHNLWLIAENVQEAKDF